jgi:tetratricopeptide (TPR) repeat protein
MVASKVSWIGRGMSSKAIVFVLALAVVFAGTPEYDHARELYQRTEYKQALDVLNRIPSKEGAELQLMGQSYFMLGDYRKATETFEKAIALGGVPPAKASELYHWLGRTFGRRAETSSVLTAPGYATKTRQMFERAVQLDPNNQEALNDLFDYYLQAPGFLGGGIQKAEEVARRIASLDAAEGHYAQAQLDQKRKQYKTAEDHLRRAAELAPAQVGRVLDLAKYLASRGRLPESEAMFQQAARMAPQSPKVLFERAQVYVRQNRNLKEARQLLEEYLRSPLTPDDPPKGAAEELLRKIPQETAP